MPSGPFDSGQMTKRIFHVLSMSCQNQFRGEMDDGRTDRSIQADIIGQEQQSTSKMLHLFGQNSLNEQKVCEKSGTFFLSILRLYLSE